MVYLNWMVRVSNLHEVDWCGFLAPTVRTGADFRYWLVHLVDPSAILCNYDPRPAAVGRAEAVPWWSAADVADGVASVVRSAQSRFSYFTQFFRFVFAVNTLHWTIFLP